MVTVTKVEGDTVVVDGNHPLAGQHLNFDVEIATVREASEEEVEKEIADLAATYNMEVEQVKGLLSADMLQHDIAVKKAVELVTSTATVK